MALPATRWHPDEKREEPEICDGLDMVHLPWPAIGSQSYHGAGGRISGDGKIAAVRGLSPMIFLELW